MDFELECGKSKKSSYMLSVFTKSEKSPLFTCPEEQFIFSKVRDMRCATMQELQRFGICTDLAKHILSFCETQFDLIKKEIMQNIPPPLKLAIHPYSRIVRVGIEASISEYGYPDIIIVYRDTVRMVDRLSFIDKYTLVYRSATSNAEMFVSNATWFGIVPKFIEDEKQRRERRIRVAIEHARDKRFIF